MNQEQCDEHNHEEHKEELVNDMDESNDSFEELEEEEA